MNPPRTLESLIALSKTPEGFQQLRIMVAELCGWTRIGTTGNHGAPYGLAPDHAGMDLLDLPDYVGSLDAMAEAEKLLTRDDAHEYHDHLIEIVREAAPLCSQCEAGEPWAKRWTFHATALQRAIAFILCKQARA
jgi:hypothetical protein